MNQEKIKSPSKASQREDNSWVDVHNDALMVELGIHLPNVTPRDKNVWTKTPNEKRLLKVMRNSVKKEKIHFHSSPVKSIPVLAKLIIYLKKNDKFSNTTYSTKCKMHKIDSILQKYCWYNKKTNCFESLVSKYSYNGRTYAPEERPFWG